jgi:DNA primase
MASNNRKYVVFDLTEVDTIDFNEVMETTAETLRKNLANTQSFVKYEGDQPVSVAALITKSQSYTHEEIINLLNGDDWNDPNEPTALV